MLSDTDGIEVEKVSDIIGTEPWGFEAEQPFLNCVARCMVEENISPEHFLKICKDIEKRLGRHEDVEYDGEGRRIYHSRVIDMDILLFGNMRIHSPSLTVPHPLVRQREFALIPLRQIASPAAAAAFPDIIGDL